MEVGDLVLKGGEVGVDAVAEVADAVLPAEFELETGVQHVTGVLVSTLNALLRTRLDADEEVPGVLLVPVETEGQAVVEHAQVETGIILLGDFPVQTRVGQAGGAGTIGACAILIILIPRRSLGDGFHVRITAQDVHVTVAAPGGAELQETDEVTVDIVLEERFIADGPACGNGGEVTPADILGKFG